MPVTHWDINYSKIKTQSFTDFRRQYWHNIFFNVSQQFFGVVLSTIIDGVDYGPLAGLVGTWVGQKGLDVAPNPDNGQQQTEFIDRLKFTATGIVRNAGKQTVVGLTYEHVVRRVSDQQVFHEQIGHWLYDAHNQRVMHSLTLGRGVCVLAGGEVAADQQQIVFKVAAKAGSDSFGIVQSPFMLEHAKTTAFTMQLTLKDSQHLQYQQATQLQIYDKAFEHIDSSDLVKQAD